jgi:hypothetical protein
VKRQPLPIVMHRSAQGFPPPPPDQTRGLCRGLAGALRAKAGSRVRLGVVLLMAVAAVLASGCGKKGPPLPPIVRLPAPPGPFVARRLGAVVWLQVRIPVANADKTTPADIERVDVYALTGAAADAEAIFKSGTRVVSIPVRKPAEEDRESGPKGRRDLVPPAERPAPPPRPAASMATGFDQGDTVVVTEPLGPEQFREVATTAPATKKPEMPAAWKFARWSPPMPPGPSALPVRTYAAVGINHKGQKGTASARQAVVLAAPASAPAAPTITYIEKAFSVEWTPAADALPPIPPGDLIEARPTGARQVVGAYNVYEVPAPASGASGAGAPAPPAPGGRMPTPVNAKPLAGPPLVDERMEFGTPRCYVVRAVTFYGAQPIEGDASPVTCTTPVDTFPPAAPTSLRAVAGEHVVSLIWDANREADLAGYLVLRSELPDGSFVPLTPEPIADPTFNDTTVKPGVRYAYVVVAVDASKNRSAPSNRVEEAGR